MGCHYVNSSKTSFSTAQFLWSIELAAVCGSLIWPQSNVEPCGNLEQIIYAKRLCVLSAVVLLAVSLLILAGTWNEKGAQQYELLSPAAQLSCLDTMSYCWDWEQENMVWCYCTFKCDSIGKWFSVHNQLSGQNCWCVSPWLRIHLPVFQSVLDEKWSISILFVDEKWSTSTCGAGYGSIDAGYML